MNFEHFLGPYNDERIDSLILGHVAPEVAEALGAKVRRVLLSIDTVRKQRLRHPELEPDHYRSLKPALQLGEYRQDSQRSAVVLFIDTKLHDYGMRACVKATANGRELYLVSFCFLRKRTYARELRKGFPVIRPHQQI